MNDSEKIKMTINIAGEHIQVAVPFNRQDNVRDAEKECADLYDLWRKKWPSKSDKEILVMIAYRFAFHYQELHAEFEDALMLARNCGERLDDYFNHKGGASS